MPGPRQGLPGVAPEPPGAPFDTVFFLSDYGTSDEFVGVVHAVLRRLAPHVAVIDLTHEIPAFDVRAGAATLARALPYLGSGVVLAVVDPGVGGPRRPVAVELARGPGGGGGPQWFVAPDNGLLTPALRIPRAVGAAVALTARPATAVTFDGRDVFAPAAAALCTGADPASLGTPVDPSDLLRLPEPEVTAGAGPGGRHRLRTEVTWVDRFGNVQLAALEDVLPASVGAVDIGAEAHDPGVPTTVRRVRTFSDLGPGQPGILSDANSHLALVVNRGSAADLFGVVAGSVLHVVW
ncbi:MAG: SAM hydrolase/SAM-dependent halogenase family protein [Acidimicrobiales bacterium]